MKYVVAVTVALASIVMPAAPAGSAKTAEPPAIIPQAIPATVEPPVITPPPVIAPPTVAPVVDVPPIVEPPIQRPFEDEYYKGLCAQLQEDKPWIDWQCERYPMQ